MPRQKSDHLTTVEQAIMETLWQHGPMTVRAITDIQSQEKDVAYTTVQTMCKIMEDKGYVSSTKEGRAFVYTPELSQKQARSGALASLMNRFFGNSPELLAQHLMEQSDIELKDLEKLQQQIDQADD